MYVTVSGTKDFLDEVLQWLGYKGYSVKNVSRAAINMKVTVYVYFNPQKKIAGRCTKYSKISNAAIEHITEKTAIRIFKLTGADLNVYLKNKI